MRRPLPRLLLLYLPLALLRAGTPGKLPSFQNSVQPFLAHNCYTCHNAKLASGDLNLQELAAPAESREKWESVLAKMESGEMPPQGLARPDPSELKTVTRWIENEFERADRQAKPNPGRVTARRLNRAEYNNTVRDLLGVRFRPADDFPQDDSGYGFDNNGDVLSLSPALMEKYMAASERIARTALFGAGQLKPTVTRYQPPTRPANSSYTALDYDVTGLGLPSALHATHTFPVDAEYVFRISPSGNRPLPSDSFRIALWIDGKQQSPTLEFDGTTEAVGLEGRIGEVRVKLPEGEHWVAASVLHQFEGLPPSYGGLNPSTRPAPPVRDISFFTKPPAGAAPKELAEFEQRREAFRKRREEQSAPKISNVSVRINYVEVKGPFEQKPGPAAESLSKIYTCGHLDGRHKPACARIIVQNLARRAYRRPVQPQEVDRLLSLVSEDRKRGDSFEESIAVAVEAMLVSPHFLFRIERDRRPAGDAHSIGEHELASRLSYFLWSSMPDDELLRCADRQTLRKPEILAAQIRRMLKDPKSEALVENFGGQWLETRRLESVQPDRARFPDFDEYLRMSMRKETSLFLDSIVREDRSLLDLIDAKYSYLNERLARLYRIQNVKGPEFRKVDLTGTPRGGVLTQASVLTVSSYSTRTSVVLRGKWLLDNILNAPPPPPPADTPNLDEAATGASASLRQQMESHRANAACASCHAKMDPLGFTLENFDGIGAWRTADGKFPIDASGALPDGRSIQGPGGLKALVKTDREAFAQCVTEKLMTYALGRGLARYDKPAEKTIIKQVAAGDYRFSSLVLAIAESLPFQMQRGDRPE